MKKVALLACFTVLSLSVQAEPDGPSAYEAAGQLDAYIKLCSDNAPEKALQYKQRILTGASCGKPVADMEKSVADVRDSKNVQVRAAYKRYFDKAIEPFSGATKKQKLEFCEFLSEVKC